MAKKRDTNIKEFILDSIDEGVFTVDKNFKITFFNKKAEEITGISKEDALGEYCFNVFHSSICDGNCSIERSIKEKKTIKLPEIYIITARGEKLPISVCASPLKDDKNRIIGGVEIFRDISEYVEIKKELEKRHTLYDIVSKNEKMLKIFKVLPLVAKSDSTVLIIGESGTGKELIAKAIHNLSNRKNKPFVAVNCGAIPENLLESELFGYKKGAFTGATTDKRGKFKLAEGGTLFLDEIGDLPLPLQVKLLRVLEAKEFEPLGALKPEKADVRIIAATNKNLSELVKTGDFRSDLFYRLDVVRIELPPLRERKEDIPLLVLHFIKKFNALKGKRIKGVKEEVLNLFMKYDFPGNIRELENIIEYAFIVCDSDYIEKKHLPDTFFQNFKRHGEKMPGKKNGEEENKDEDKIETVDEVLKKTILKALKRNNFKRVKTAKQLGISKDTLRRWIEKYNISEES